MPEPHRLKLENRAVAVIAHRAFARDAKLCNLRREFMPVHSTHSVLDVLRR